MRRRGRRSTHAWPRMAVFSSFAFLSFGRTSSRLTANQRDISYGTGDPGIFAPYQLLPLSLVQLRRSKESPNTKATLHTSDPPTFCPLPTSRALQTQTTPIHLPSPREGYITDSGPSTLLPPSLLPLHPPFSLSLQGRYSSPRRGFCAISSRLWGSHCIEVSRLRASSSPPSPSTLPDSATSLGPCSTRAKHVK